MPYCENCSKQLSSNAHFCPECGFTIDGEESAATMPEDICPVPGITLCKDGKFRWTCELNMWKNPVIMITLLKIFGGIVIGMALFMFFLELERGIDVAAALFFKFNLYGWLLALVMCIIAYALYALIQGGRYCVMFEMDSRGIKHMQMARQFNRARVIMFIGVLAGAASGNPTVAGSSLLAGTRNSSYSEFSRVKLVVANRRRGVIYVNENLHHNQIYVTREQYDFVLAHIRAHCGNRVRFKGD